MRMSRGNITFVPGFAKISEPSAESGWEGCPRAFDLPTQPGTLSEGWEDAIRQAVGDFVNILQTKAQTELTLIAISGRLKCLEVSLAEMKSRGAVVVPIQSLAPEPFELLKPIQAVVQQIGEDYVATFFDANINASGETQEEAITNLKDLLVGSFETFAGITDKLGPGPSRQLAVLRQFLKRV
jgi:hypothetical protein